VEVIGHRLVHDDHQAVRCDGSGHRRQYIDRTRHVMNTLEGEGSIERAKLGQGLPSGGDKARSIGDACCFGVRVGRLDRGLIDIDPENRCRWIGAGQRDRRPSSAATNIDDPDAGPLQHGLNLRH
jgi:hypothetical protein